MKVIYKSQVLGIVSENSYEVIKKGLKRKFNEGLALNFFCTYSEYEIPFGTRFNYLKNNLSGTIVEIQATLVDATQQWGLPFDNVPMGYKTISRFEFTELGLDLIKREIPVIDSWSSTKSVFEFLRMQ
ncbi:hypothetical protein BDD43_5102 [Mucilaginibacter gracilis]|uniref:Uncharacterized protein n=1 Tax=Mucilaginibacter gracilis TaxID=423350 RepID=A0A495J9W1_9SPHI|nr:hypothetical protein [Mucilaginibacter gracilis]RKR84849.1 hypothetical protein BDD43_5102 [Mucilaginibacter gracilis]